MFLANEILTGKVEDTIVLLNLLGCGAIREIKDPKKSLHTVYGQLPNKKSVTVSAFPANIDADYFKLMLAGTTKLAGHVADVFLSSHLNVYFNGPQSNLTTFVGEDKVYTLVRIGDRKANTYLFTHYNCPVMHETIPAL